MMNKLPEKTWIKCCDQLVDITDGAACPGCGAHYGLMPLEQLKVRMGIFMGGRCHSCGKWHSETWTADDGRVFCYRCGGER